MLMTKISNKSIYLLLIMQKKNKFKNV